MPSQGFDFLAGAGIPQFHRAVSTPGRQELAIGAETHRCNPVGMPSQGFDFLAGAGIPQFHRAV